LGISTPLASLLMIVLIVEAVAFQTSMVATNRDWQMDVVASNEYARQRLAERLVILNATVSYSGANLNFTNVGGAVAYVHHIWVISISDNSIHTSFPVEPSPVSVPPGATVLYPLSVTLDPAKTYDFKAVTTLGNIATIRYPPLVSSSTTSSGTTTSYTTVSTTSYTTVSTTSYTTVSTTLSTTSNTTVSTTTYTTVSTTSYTTVSTTSYTTISTTISGGAQEMISGALMIAYQAKDANGYNSGPTDSCHQESPLTLTGISGIQTGSTLYFLDPWLTTAVLTSARTDSGTQHTAMYYLVNATNTKSTPIVASGGTLDLTWYGSNHIDASLLGVYYSGAFHVAGSGAIPSGSQFYAIFKTDHIALSGFSGGVFFIGSAAITNGAKDNTYYSAQLAIDGLWVKSTCTSSP
jgi:hypothetical protein